MQCYFDSAVLVCNIYSKGAAYFGWVSFVCVLWGFFVCLWKSMAYILPLCKPGIWNTECATAVAEKKKSGLISLWFMFFQFKLPLNVADLPMFRGSKKWIGEQYLNTGKVHTKSVCRWGKLHQLNYIFYL